MVNVRKTRQEVIRKLTPQENRLKNKLHTFYKKNIKSRQEPTEVLRRVYENQIKTVIRKATEDAYFTGITTVKDAFQKSHPFFFVSGTDIQNIKELTEKMHNQFWTTTEKLHRREHEFIVTPNSELELKHQFDVEAAYIGIAALMVYTAFNTSVKSKMVQVI